MKNRFFLLLGLFTCVGGSSTDSSSDRFECLHSIPHGAYFASFDKLSTSTREPDCGSLSGSDVEVLSGIVKPHESAGCTIVYKNDDPRVCETTATFNCDDGTWKMNLNWSVKPDLLDENRFVGVLYAEMERFSGWTCVGTYGVVGERSYESRR